MKLPNCTAVLPCLLILASCVSVMKEVRVKPGDAISVNFLAGSNSTRTNFEDQTRAGFFPVRWADGDEVALSLNADGWQTLVAVPSQSRATATFSGDFVAAESYRFYAVSPAAAVKDLNDSKGAWLLNIPWSQTPTEGSADPRAIIIGASTMETALLPSPVTFLFDHLTSYIRLTLNGIPASYGGVSSIDLVSAMPFAGDWYYSFSDGEFTAREASRSVHVTTSSAENVWIACAPVNLSRQEFTVTVNCASGSLRKTALFPSGRQYASGMVSEVSVDMSSAAPVSVSESAASFLENTVPGFYPAIGTPVCYKAGANQLSRDYVRGSITFSILSPSSLSLVSMSGIPPTAALGSSFTLSYSTISALGNADASYSVTVVKEDGALLWLLSSEGDRFIVKK